MGTIKMENTTKKIQLWQGIKNLIWPVIVAIFSLGMLWSAINSKITSNASAVEDLEIRVDETEGVQNLILQRLSSIETKIDYIIDEVDKLESE